MQKILLMNFRSKHIDMQNQSNMDSVQSHALKSMIGPDGNSQIDSVRSSNNDDDAGSSSNNNLRNM
jgi:hypothetical protein